MKGLKTFLMLSIVINVFLIGALAGGGYRWISMHGTTPQPRGLRFAAAELSSQRQMQLRKALRDTRHDALPMIENARQGRRDVARVLSAPTLDRAALDQALAQTRDADIALRAQVEGTVADFASTLSPDERLALVDALISRGPLHGVKLASKVSSAQE